MYTCMFPIKPSIASGMVHVHKNLGMCSKVITNNQKVINNLTEKCQSWEEEVIFYSSHFNSMQKLKLQNQFEDKVLLEQFEFYGETIT